MRPLLALLLVALLSGCDDRSTLPPPPAVLTAEAVGHYCGMTVAAHPGPKGQIHVAGQAEPVWFTSVRDTRVFTLLPEEPKDIRGIYVTDMGRANSWNAPGPGSWIEARGAVYVIDSRRSGGMGAPEAVPFGDRAAAERFIAEQGGRVVSWDDIPADYVLGTTETEAAHGQH